MNRKPDKVEEPVSPYLVRGPDTKPAASPQEAGAKKPDMQVVRKNNARLMQIHRKVLQKLAQ